MKKFLLMGACLLGVFAVQGVSAEARSGCCSPCNNQGCCQPNNCCEYPCGECYCRYVTYQPCTYYTTRCIEEKIPCQKTCYRYVPRYYQVQRCRYVPQYYCETRCCQELESYCVDDCKTCTRKICEPRVRYIPRYYWKHECRNTGSDCAQPACSTCPAAPAPAATK